MGDGARSRPVEDPGLSSKLDRRWGQDHTTINLRSRWLRFSRAGQFWGKLKTEMVYHERFATKAQARAAVFEYIEVFYNRKRLHAALDYLSPEAFEARRIA